MAQTDKRKLELALSLEEAAEFFNDLADGLREGSLDIGETEIDLTEFKDLAVSIKQFPGMAGDEQVFLKLKVKYPKETLFEPMSYTEGDFAVSSTPPPQETVSAGEAPTAPAKPARAVSPHLVEAASAAVGRTKPKYKELKKRMKRDFKVILAELEYGRLPAMEVTHRFCRDSELMCTYSGKGDPFYPDYLKANQDYLSAATDGDLEAARQAVNELNAFYTSCHKRFK